MRPETFYRVRVRDVAAALDNTAELELVQHNVSQLEVRRYLRLDDAQWWELIGFLKERERVHDASCSDYHETKIRDARN